MSAHTDSYGYLFTKVQTPCGVRFAYLAQDIGEPESWNSVILRSALSVESPCCLDRVGYDENTFCQSCHKELPGYYLPTSVDDLLKVLRRQGCPASEECVGTLIWEVQEGCKSSATAHDVETLKN